MAAGGGAVHPLADERLADAIEVVRRHRRRDGRWPLQNRHRGKVYFEMGRLGAPSRWNTLRVLRWRERGLPRDRAR